MQRQYILVRKLLRNIKEITQRAHGVKKTLYWRRCDVSLTSFQRHVPAGGWMVRIRAQLVDPIQRQKRYMYFGHVVCWLLDAHFIVGTS